MKNERLNISQVQEMSLSEMKTNKAGSPTILTPLIPIACTAVSVSFSILIAVVYETIHSEGRAYRCRRY